MLLGFAQDYRRVILNVKQELILLTRWLLYDMYARFENTYNHHHNVTSLLTSEKFIANYPLFVINCCRQEEALRSSAVDGTRRRYYLLAN